MIVNPLDKAGSIGQLALKPIGSTGGESDRGSVNVAAAFAAVAEAKKLLLFAIHFLTTF